MSAMTAEQRGDLAEAMLPEAAGLVVEVHEGSADDIRLRLQGLTRHELEAVAVVLAGLADPDRGLKEALSWVTFDEAGDPLDRPSDSKRTVREVAPARRDRSRVVDLVAVDRALSPGPKVVLCRDERRIAVERGIRRGMSYDDVADRLSMDRDAVKQAWERAKRRARSEGRWIPTAPVGEIRNVA